MFADVPGPVPSGLCTARARLLPIGSAIVGQRLQVVTPIGPSQSLSRLFPGSAFTLADVPQMALLCRVPALSANNVRRMILRGLPDARVVEGEYSPSGVFTSDLNFFFRVLGQWLFRGRDLTPQTTRLFTVSALGVFNTETPHLLAPLDIVRVSRAITAFGQFHSQRLQVATVGPGTNGGTFTGWLGGSTSGGTVRKDAIVFPQVDPDNITIGRVITRRVGRPFVQYRGRRSRSRS